MNTLYILYFILISVTCFVILISFSV